jgi:hypothetical protein
MFYNIFQNALAAGDPAVARLNSAMELIGLKSKKFQKVRMFDCENNERMSFLGHEAQLLSKRNATTGKRNVQVLLEHLWPSGDASESKEGRNFVNRSIVLWECWGEVVELMSERDPANLRKSKDTKHGDGFARFGKVLLQVLDLVPQDALQVVLLAHLAGTCWRLHARAGKARHVPGDDEQQQGGATARVRAPRVPQVALRGLLGKA